MTSNIHFKNESMNEGMNEGSFRMFFLIKKLIFLYINLGYLLIKEGRKEGR
jgi:hypothetical protein